MRSINYSIVSLDLTNSNGTKIDLLPFFVSLQLYEDIYQPFLTGKLFINDVKYIFESLPLIGGEELFMKFAVQNDNDSIEKELENFAVMRYGFSELDEEGEQKSKIYALDIIEKEGLDALNEHSISFKEKLVSEIVKTISSDIIGKDIETLNLEGTRGNFDIAFPFMTPIEMINHVSKKYAVNSSGNYGYIFYTDFDQKLHYTSINTLISGKKKYFLKVGSKFDDDENPDTILAKEFERVVDIDENIREGLFGIKNFFFDIETKAVVETDYKYADFKGENNFLGSKSFYNKDFDKYNITAIDTHPEAKDEENVMLFSSLDNYNILISQEGNFAKTIGMVAEISFDAFSNDDSENENDNFTGNWLAIKQVHTFDRNGYNLMTNFIKNAFTNQPNMKNVESV